MLDMPPFPPGVFVVQSPRHAWKAWTKSVESSRNRLSELGLSHHPRLDDIAAYMLMHECNQIIPVADVRVCKRIFVGLNHILRVKNTPQTLPELIQMLKVLRFNRSHRFDTANESYRWVLLRRFELDAERRKAAAAAEEAEHKRRMQLLEGHDG